MRPCNSVTGISLSATTSSNPFQPLGPRMPITCISKPESISDYPMPERAPDNKNPAPRKKYVRAVGPRLRLLLLFIFGLVAVLAANSVYLSAISFLEWLKADPNTTYQSWFYMVMFGTHLGLGLLLVLPVVIFGVIHLLNSYNRPNRSAVKVGYLLFATSLIVLFSGLLLTRADI